jgi:hypothetical protein
VTAPSRPRARRRTRRIPRWAVTLLFLTLAFLVGLALGQALHDNPKPGGTQTIVRTFRP